MDRTNRLLPWPLVERERAIALAERFLSGDERVLATFEGDVCPPDGEGSYFELAGGGVFAFTDDGWLTSSKISWEALVVPADGSRAAAATLLAEIGRRAPPGFIDQLEEIDPEMLVEYAVIAGGLDLALNFVRRRREVAPLEWRAARNVAWRAVEAVLVSLDRVGDRPGLARELRALMVLESYRWPAIEATCEICGKRRAQLRVPTSAATRAACTPCFVGVKYLPPDHDPVERYTLRELTCQAENTPDSALSH